MKQLALYWDWFIAILIVFTATGYAWLAFGNFDQPAAGRGKQRNGQ